jgi:ubiquinone/menaquinone biosynthesis C-methylase UbiE
VGDVHPTARGFEQAAASYDEGRPGYPPAAVDALAAGLGVGPGRRIADIGAGTGKLTRELVARGAEVLAVEPASAMRATLERTLPGITVLAGTAEALPMPTATVDACVAAQAFHWFDAARALPELHRVTRPGGGLGIIVNRRDLTTPVQAALDELLAADRGDTPSWAHDDWLDALTGSPWFVPDELDQMPFVQHLDAAGFQARVRSISFVASLSGEARQRIEDGVAAVFRAHARDGTVALHYRTEVRVLRRRDVLADGRGWP